MKKLLLLSFILLFSSNVALAQMEESNDVATEKVENQPKKKAKKRVSYDFPKHSVGLNLGVNHTFINLDYPFSDGSSKRANTGVSAGFEYKRTFTKYFGMLVNLGYDYLGATAHSITTDPILKNKLNFNFLFAFQWESPRDTAGFVPYVGIGPNITFLGPAFFSPGIALSAGVRYNFGFGLYLGLGFDYQYDINFIGIARNNHVVRGKIAVGYRY